MQVSLSLEDEGGGKATAHATVTKDDGSPQKNVSVTFRVNKKDTGRPARVDDDGIATKELRFKIGEKSSVSATVVGSPHVATQEDIIPERAKRRPTTWIEWAISGLFLIVVLKFGYTAITVVGLIITMMILFARAFHVTAKSGGDETDIRKEFVARVQNNNWVFYTMFWLMIFSITFWVLGLNGKPIPEMNPLKALGGAIKDMVAPPPTDPWVNDGWNFTNILLGDEGGWGKAAFSFLVWTLLAYPVSFWDEIKRFSGKHPIVVFTLAGLICAFVAKKRAARTR